MKDHNVVTCFLLKTFSTEYISFKACNCVRFDLRPIVDREQSVTQTKIAAIRTLNEPICPGDNKTHWLKVLLILNDFLICV